jgi:hypothetical protein
MTTVAESNVRHTNGRKVRVDALPEYLAFRDMGCDLSPTCLRCPLERCRYDEPGGAARLMRGSRDGAVCERRAEGAAIEKLATEFGLSRRSVFRILAAGRQEARRREKRLRHHPRILMEFPPSPAA